MREGSVLGKAENFTLAFWDLEMLTLEEGAFMWEGIFELARKLVIGTNCWVFISREEELVLALDRGTNVGYWELEEMLGWRTFSGRSNLWEISG